MPFTSLADAVTASRSDTMDQVYANYDSALARSLSYLSTANTGDPALEFSVAASLDDGYIDQIKSELESAGWYRVRVDRNRSGGVSDLWNVKAYKNETPPQATPKPQVPDAADEEDGIPGPGEVGAPAATQPASTPAASTTEATSSSTSSTTSEPAADSTPAAAEPAASETPAPSTPAPVISATTPAATQPAANPGDTAEATAPESETPVNSDTATSQDGTSGTAETPTDANGASSTPASGTDDTNKSS